MTAFYEHQLDELIARYQERRARAVELRRQISDISASATAPRKVVKITVGAQGEVRAVEFPTDAYRRMTPAELAAIFMTTIEQAREKAMAALSELMTPELPPGLNVLGLLQGKVDFASAMPETPAIPDVVKEYTEHGRKPHEQAGAR
jgi:DNA-binding protein YbaB